VHPRDTEEAQYNLAYPVAAALVTGELGPEQVLPPVIEDRAILALADRVVAEVVPAYEEAFPAKAYADVVVTTVDGNTFTATELEAPWEPPHGLPTDRELEEKFRALTSPVLGDAQAEALAGEIWHMDEGIGACQLIGRCNAGRAETRA
jgi:2-methylcitrate dehydratase PrpD